MNRREAIVAGVAGIAVAVAAPPIANAETSSAEEPEVESIRALLRAHDEAFTNQDLKGVMTCFAPKAAIMGTGPGEVWSGPDEIKVAYQHFFEGFDKGEQKFEYQFKIGGVTPLMGWLMTAGNGEEGRERHRVSRQHLDDSRQTPGKMADCLDAFLDADWRFGCREQRRLIKNQSSLL
jgi:ketosteroid isomerase-like protein